MDTKRCSYCSESKSLDAFYKNCKAKDGRQGYCKVCINLYSKRRNSQVANDDRVQAAKDQLRCASANLKNFSEIFRLIRQPNIKPYLQEIQLSEVLSLKQTSIVPLGYKFKE